MILQVGPEDLNVAVLGAVVGGIVAYAGGWLQDVLHRVRKRRSIATDLLIEMDWLEERLNEIEAASAPSGRARPLALHFHNAFLPEILLFRPKTVASLLRYVGYANELGSRLERLQSRAVEPGPTWDHELKRLAAILKEQTAGATEALVGEGGKWSARYQDEANVS